MRCAMSFAPPVAYLSEIFASWQGEGARVGQRHLFVRFAGCNIRCRWCDTPDSLTRVRFCRVDYPDGRSETFSNPLALQTLAEIVRECCRLDPSIAMIAITGGEPMVQAVFLSRWFAQAPPPVACLLETNALVVQGLAAVLPGIEVVSADVKLPSNTGEQDPWDRHRTFFELCRNSEMYVKMPVDQQTSSDEVARAAEMIAATAPRATLFVQPITEADAPGWRIDQQRLAQLAAIASQFVRDTRVLPQVHKLVGIR